MKKLLLFLLMTPCILPESFAQKDTVVKKVYQTYVSFLSKKRTLSGYLLDVKDSSVVITSSPKLNYLYKGRYKSAELDYDNINCIKVRNKSTRGLLALVGGVTGALIGLAIILPQQIKDDNELAGLINCFSIMGVTVGSAAIGVTVGLAIGSVKKSYRIDGKWEEFDRQRPVLEGYSITKQLGWDPTTIRIKKLGDVVLDADSNVYGTIAVGGQVWMASDLVTKHFTDGAKIEGIPGKSSRNQSRYDWNAVAGSRKICPAGWHVPTEADWTSLFNSLGGEGIAGNIMKAGFTRNDGPSQWWSSTEKGPGEAASMYLNTQTAGVMITSAPKSTPLAVRCLRDN